MDKHIELLTQLLEWYWDKNQFESYTWITLLPYTQKYWLNYYVYDHLKDN